MTETGNNVTAADVYTGDTAPLDLSSGLATNVYRYAIDADAEPDVLARVASLLNLANRVPLAVSLRRKAFERVHIAADMEQISATTADMIRRKLMQLTCVVEVELIFRNSVRENV